MNRKNLQRLLKQAHRDKYRASLLNKPDQGKAASCFTVSEASNHFLRNGFSTRFADWRFVHRARLGCVPLNGTRRFGEGDTRCRRCGYPKETIPHVLSHCTTHSAAWQHRHNAVQTRIADAIPKVNTEMTVNKQFEDTGLRPDIVTINRRTNTAWVLDITVPFENTYQAFQDARDNKRTKYQPVVEILQKRGYTTAVDAVIVGCLGSWDPENDDPLHKCGITRNYLKLMRKLICSDAIKWSRDIYVEHITGIRQYELRDDHSEM